MSDTFTFPGFKRTDEENEEEFQESPVNRLSSPHRSPRVSPVSSPSHTSEGNGVGVEPDGVTLEKEEQEQMQEELPTVDTTGERAEEGLRRRPHYQHRQLDIALARARERRAGVQEGESERGESSEGTCDPTL